MGALALVALLTWPSLAVAKKSDNFGHSYDQVWRAAVRLIRVDQGYAIRDRDESIGYMLFDYQDDGRSYPGSIELIRIEENGVELVRVAIQIPAMPGYIERMLLDKLARKLVNEYGEVAQPEPPSDDSDEE